MRVSTWNHYIALGDAAVASHPAWPNRLAEILEGHAELEQHRMRFSQHTLSSGGLSSAIHEGFDGAVRLGADLVSLSIRGDELLAGSARPALLAESLEAGIRRLRMSGATVLLANCFGPRFDDAPTDRRLRAAEFTGSLWEVARRSGATLLDLWSVRALHSPALWTPDRVEPTDEGHRLIAACAAHALGVPYAEVGMQTRAVARLVGGPQ